MLDEVKKRKGKPAIEALARAKAVELMELDMEADAVAGGQAASAAGGGGGP